MTPAQKALWHALRRRQLSSFEFHRQRGLGRADVDFYCDERRLVVVIDGPDAAQQAGPSAQRDLAWSQEGIRVLHVTEAEVSDALYEVLRRITEALNAPHTPAPFPSDPA
jgi:very-short-patch-repair endonuclease